MGRCTGKSKCSMICIIHLCVCGIMNMEMTNKGCVAQSSKWIFIYVFIYLMLSNCHSVVGLLEFIAICVNISIIK